MTATVNAPLKFSFSKEHMHSTSTFTPAASPGRSPPSTSPPPSDDCSPAADSRAPSALLELITPPSNPATPILLTGATLTLQDLLLITSPNPPPIALSPSARPAITASIDALSAHLKASHSIYGVTTGFGASADSRTSHPEILQAALLQMQHIGILPANSPSHAMPDAWVRGAMAVRINSLLRGHSAVRWDVLERMLALLNANILPLVPLRGSISASGDLSPLSYIAGAVSGHKGIFCRVGPPEARIIVPAAKALEQAGLTPVEFRAKEVLGLINGTAVSTAVAATVLGGTAHALLLAQALTALAVEVSLGSAEPFDPWVAATARPHPGQMEVAGNIWHLLSSSQLARDRHEAADHAADIGLKQDRYPLRTSPQWLGPLIEDVALSISQLGIEANSTTDNPLIDTTTPTASGFSRILHAGNFQAMHVTSAMEKARSALQATGKLVFQQLTEVVNYCTAPLPPNLASDTDTSLSYTMKAVDIAAAAYCSELGVLAAGNVTSHVQCAEDRNQAVNSLALVSARQADEMLDVLAMLSASHVYVLCQAADLRVFLLRFRAALDLLVRNETTAFFKGLVSKRELPVLAGKVAGFVTRRFEETMREDAGPRFEGIFKSATAVVLDGIQNGNPRPSNEPRDVMEGIRLWRCGAGQKALGLFREMRARFVEGSMMAAGSLGRTGMLYSFVRGELGVPMHRGRDDLPGEEEEGRGRREAREVTTGEMVTRIYQAIRDGRMGRVVGGMLAQSGGERG